MRTFIALEVPEEVKDMVESVRKSIEFEGLVFVKREAMHITMQFLGEIGEDDAGRVKEEMSKVTFVPFRVNLRGVSYFSPDFLRVIFVKVEEGAKELSELYQKLSAAIDSAGVRFEKERYTPHLTIARVKHVKDRRGVMEAINRHAQTDFGSFEANHVVLKKSILTRNGPAYTDLYELKF